jgi:hypothetical protein
LFTLAVFAEDACGVDVVTACPVDELSRDGRAKRRAEHLVSSTGEAEDHR